MQVIFDTDGGLDDVESLLYLLAEPRVRVNAITLVAGNGTIDMVLENICRSCSFLGIEDIPIYKGTDYSLQGTKITSDGYFGANAFANIELPRSSLLPVPDCSAAQALANLTRANPKTITVICCGPLTNLAVAYMLDPNFSNNCHSVVIMGGDRDTKTYQNATDYAEFNFLCDPLAAQTVAAMFEGRTMVPATLIDWHTCWNHPLSMDMFNELFGINGERKNINKFVQLYSIIRDFSNPIIARSLWKDGFISADIFAAVVAVRPEVVVGQHRSRLITIDLQGERIGHTVFQSDLERGHFSMVDQLDMKLLENIFVDALTSVLDSKLG